MLLKLRKILKALLRLHNFTFLYKCCIIVVVTKNYKETILIENLDELRKIEFNEREKRLAIAKPQELKYNPKKHDNMSVTYVMTSTEVCGVSKIILQQANRLIKMGYKVSIISHFPRPTWFPLEEAIDFTQVPWDTILCSAIKKCDVIVVTYWRELYEAIERNIAPVVYFEQGDYHLFDLENLDDRTKSFIQKQFNVTKFVYTVSSYAASQIKNIYKHEAQIIPNAVNEDIFFFEPHKSNEKIEITIIGAEDVEFKRIESILKAVRIVRQKGYDLNLNWISPTMPHINKEAVIVNPEQKIIGDTLRKTDIYVCASMYESFCLPVLEAMTCGACVLTTNNGGNMDFVKDKENALLIEKDNIDDIVSKIEYLINNEDFRKQLALKGVEDSKKFSWDKTMKKVDEYYRKVADYEVL